MRSLTAFAVDATESARPMCCGTDMSPSPVIGLRAATLQPIGVAADKAEMTSSLSVENAGLRLGQSFAHRPCANHAESG